LTEVEELVILLPVLALATLITSVIVSIRGEMRARRDRQTLLEKLGRVNADALALVTKQNTEVGKPVRKAGADPASPMRPSIAPITSGEADSKLAEQWAALSAIALAQADNLPQLKTGIPTIHWTYDIRSVKSGGQNWTTGSIRRGGGRQHEVNSSDFSHVWGWDEQNQVL
jgi:hypothetical protein